MNVYLVTGAAGFVGSNLVETLVKTGEKVIGVDNFITGKRENLEPFLDHMEFLEGDIRDLDFCKRICQGVDFVLHEAALGSVPRSVDDPVTTNENNINGTLNMLVAARDANVERFVYAASSSAYGDTKVLPKVETMETKPLSPYAVSKLTGELYCTVFYRVYGLPTVILRYFNVFGARQDPNGAYAAVIPKFIKRVLNGDKPVIYGDGEQTRDFNYIDNVVHANLRSCIAQEECFGEVFNIGFNDRISLNVLTNKILDFLESDLTIEYGPPRKGDVKDSQADISKACEFIGYDPKINIEEGLKHAINWFQDYFR